MGVIVQYHSSPGLLFGCHEAFLDDIPVDNVPNGLDVIRTDIFVVEVVCMFPYINAQQGLQSSSRLQRILVGKALDVDHFGLGVVHEPPPAGSLNGHGLGADFGDHVVFATESFLNGRIEGTSLLVGRIGRQILPKEGVVDVTASVELQGPLEGDGSRDVSGDHGRVDLFHGGIQVGDVRLVMFRVMDLHDLCRNGRLQGVVIVWKIGQRCLDATESRKEGRRRLGKLRGKLGRWKVDRCTESRVSKFLSRHVD
mmetsp:Transcript_9443/g.16469  ORF Transcript_9443/g.16469 Transcript_9443/m.16469 type:complete len:254 (+) Transcript_9443:600-1361(+)